ncbi:TAXI family TRAP transporter solute-binding subunit [Pelagibius sp. CAU 1746]|uniref:TAXI family TRAP transporter solute-binding subunit n=1 Tax=Pelagibius sp. CAU 1746 TaxID=3140370 RepID=UPI00325BB410
MRPRTLARSLIFTTVLAAMAAGAASPPARAAEPSVTIGTGSRAGVYFQVGRALCRLLAQGSQDAVPACSALPTAGSIANLRDLRAGKLDFAVVQSDWQYHALNGTGGFSADKPDSGLRALFSVHGEPFTLVARRDAEIARLQDLAGKRVNIGNPGSGQRGTMEIVMLAMGWEKSTFTLAEELPASQQSLALCHDRVQAMIYIVGHPNDSVEQAVRLCDAVLVEVSGRPIDILVAKYPFYSRMEIPGGLYAGNPRDVQTFGVRATLVTSARIDADTVYALTKTVFENFSAFRAMHPAFQHLMPERMITDGLSAPLHEGALRYYRERGWL